MERTVEHIAETHAIAQGLRDAGKRTWQYRVTLVRPDASFEGQARFVEVRDRFARTIRGSAWFRASTKDAGEDAELWALWDEIKDAETPEHYDAVLSMIYNLADLERCWIEWV